MVGWGVHTRSFILEVYCSVYVTVVLCREVLSNLLTEDQFLDEPFSFSPLGFPSNGDSPASLLSENKSEVSNQQNDPLSIVLNMPSAFGIKTTQDKVTYINKGESGEERERERES